jgi:hypothetical protein
VLEQVGIEILSSQVGVTGSSLDSENTTLDVKEGNIESSTTEIVDENITLLVGLSGTETIGDSCGSWLVDDTEDVETGNGTSVLGSLTLVVGEVSWDSDDGLSNLLAQLDFGNFLHLRGIILAFNCCAGLVSGAYLGEDHGRDFLWGEDLGLSEVLNLNHWASLGINDLEWP